MFCSKCGIQLADDDVFCSHCGNKVQGSSELIVSQTQEIGTPSNTPEELKEYLGYARTLEVNKQTLITGKNRLQQIINTLGHRRDIPLPEDFSREGFYSFWPIFGKAFLVCALIGIFSGNDPFGTLISILLVVGIFFLPSVLPQLLIAAGIALVFSLVVCFVKTAIKKGEYRQEYKRYSQRVDDDKKRVALEKEQIRALSSQQRELDAEIRKVDSVLDSFYSLDVIKPKYRSLIPVVTMYEYFENERCYDLKGPAGAYNLYEDELLHKTIIAELNRAISMLAQIAQNQRALYDAIQESNSYADSMCRQANAMLQSNKVIEKNTAIAAYNAKIAADHAKISAYIDVYRL